MEPFTIQCTTCQSRIRVKNSKMVGQLANCPKCSSIIMISPPQQITVQSPDNASVDSMAMTKEGISGDFLQNQDTPNQPSPAEKPGQEEYKLAPASEDTPEPSQVDFQAENWEPDDDQPLLPNESWKSEKAAKTQQVLLVSFLSIAGIGLAVVGFVLFLNWYNKPPEMASSESSPANTEQADPANNVSNTPATTDIPDSEINDSAANGEDNIEQPEDANVSPDSSGETAGDTDSTQNPSTDSPEDLDSLFQQAGFGDPSEVPDALTGDPTNDSVSTQATAIPDALKALKAMEDIVGYSAQVSFETDSDVKPGAPPVTAAELGLSTAGGRPPVPAIDYTQRSNFTLAGLIIKENTFLSESINLWVHLSGIPTLVDFDVLAAGNVNANKVSLSVKSDSPQTLNDLGSAFARSGGLVASPLQNRFLAFSLPEQAVTSTLPAQIALDGVLGDSLASQAEKEEWLENCLGRLVPGSSGAWRLNGDSLTYDSTAIDALTWFRTVRLLENWKMRANVETTTAAYAPDLIVQNFVEPSQIAALEHKLTRLQVQSQPVGQTLSRICADAGMSCWIDWPVVGTAGLGPMTEDLAITLNRTVGQVLADYCDRYSLTAAVLGPESIWLTTQAAYRTQTRLYVFESQGKTPEQWEERLRPLTPVSATGIGRVVVVSSPDRKFVLVRCCRPKLEFSL